MKLTLLLRSTLSLAVNCDAGSLTELRANGSSGKLRVRWRQTLLNSTRAVVTTVKPDTCQDAGTYGYKCDAPPPPPSLSGAREIQPAFSNTVYTSQPPADTNALAQNNSSNSTVM